MARVTGHLVIPIERTGIHAADHLQHLPRGYFLRLFIAVERALYVAIGALHARARDKRTHRRAHFLRLQNLQIFEGSGPRATAGRSGRRSILGKQRDSTGRKNSEKSSAHKPVYPGSHPQVVNDGKDRNPEFGRARRPACDFPKKPVPQTRGAGSGPVPDLQPRKPVAIRSPRRYSHRKRHVRSSPRPAKAILNV
jgi:hypothetical protein